MKNIKTLSDTVRRLWVLEAIRASSSQGKYPRNSIKWLENDLLEDLAVLKKHE